MTESQARIKLLADSRRIIESGGDLDFAVRRLRYDGFSEDEIRSVVEPASSVVRWRTRLQGLGLLVLCVAVLCVFGHLIVHRGSFTSLASRGAGRGFGLVFAAAFAAGVALSRMVFGR
jgi:hypothetical protein